MSTATSSLTRVTWLKGDPNCLTSDRDDTVLLVRIVPIAVLIYENQNSECLEVGIAYIVIK